MKSKKIIICILAIFMVISIFTSNAFAMIDTGDLETPTANEDDSNDNGITVNAIKQENEKDQPTIKNNTANQNVPDTGIADTPIIPIAICVVSAVVAYTQIRKNNV